MTIARLSRAMLGVALALGTTGLLAGEITLYAAPDFHGQRLTLDRPASDLERADFNDRASSIVVREGTWEVCTDAHFGGRCQTLRPGEYADLSRSLENRISSVREIGGGYESRYDRAPSGGYGGPAAAPREGYSREPRAVLYEGENFRGRSFEIDRNGVQNLEPRGFNDRAASLQVTEGRWMFCSDAYFQGECRTFEPGNYPRLPGELDHRISSGRRVSER